MVAQNLIYCIDVLDGLNQIDKNSVDIVIADPPYNIGKDFGNSMFKKEISEYVEWCEEWINKCFYILKDTGTIFIYGFSEILSYISVNISYEKRWLIWHYTNRTIPSSNFWQRSHEAIIVTWKGNKLFNRDDVREPYTEIFLKNAAGKVRKDTKGRFGSKETVYEAHKKGALPRDVIKIPALAGGAGRKERWFYCVDCEKTYFPDKLKDHKNHEIFRHPTQKPLALTEKLIISCKPKENGLLVIPFAGSGSEAFVAKKLGIDFIGFDINGDYVKMANQLLEM